MQPLNRFIPMPAIPEERALYYFEQQTEEDYEKALLAIKADSGIFKQVCQNSYHHIQVDVLEGNDRHDKQHHYLQENK